MDKLKSYFSILFILSLPCVFINKAQAEIKNAFLLKSERGVNVTILKKSEQKLEQRYLLIEGTGTEWDDKLTEVNIIEKGAESIDYNITWKNKPYTMLAGRSGSYSLSLPKPYKNIEGLYIPSPKEDKVDLRQLESRINALKN